MPASCLLCENPQLDTTAFFCPDCLRELPWIGTACYCCGRPLPDDTLVGQRCGVCQQKPPPIDHSIAAFQYQEPIAKLIQMTKYHHRLDILEALGCQLADVISRQHGIAERNVCYKRLWPQALLPVPLHSHRLMHRGYNQSVELARILARRLGLPLLRHGSRRVRPTVSQTRLNTSQRRNNVHHAFQINSNHLPDQIAIIDDVMTSGQTIYELAKTLRHHGVHSIDVWVVARATTDIAP